ncbi:hypothetical protein BGX28_006070 [Mortierella sp. GBA30]|nr:hypothetical protein BGX28_006070 [Mortierella sp. GBA30]
MENCRRVSGPSFCEDVRAHRSLNLGFLACDPSLPYRNYAAGVFSESKVSQNGALWLYDLNKPGSSAEKLVLKEFSGPFHPSGLSIAPTTESSTLARIILLVVNHVPFDQPRVEVLYYYPARKNLVHKKTIFSKHFYAAHKILASSSPFVHKIDDTPSFIVSNDHGYNLSDWKRTYEERFSLPAASLAYYNARANVTHEIAWRLQMPSALVESQEPDSVWMAQAKSGSLDLYGSHILSPEHQEQNVLSVDTEEPITITWPGMMVEETLRTGLVNVGIDYDPEAKTLVTVAHSSWNAYVNLAKEHLNNDPHQHQDMSESIIRGRNSGMIVSRAKLYPVRIGETNPKPLKDVIFDPEETPKQYRLQYFHEPLISHDGSEFGTPSAIAVVSTDCSKGNEERVLVTGQYEHGFLDCRLL